MTRKGAIAASPVPWADGPYKLIPTPNTYRKDKHGCVRAASAMTRVHNILIRGLNAIVLQGPHIRSSDQPVYLEKDAKDFCFFIHAWCKTVDHHHAAEENVMFPRWESLLGEPGMLKEASHQHDAFHNGLLKLDRRAWELYEQPVNYDWNDLQSIIDSFAEPLMDHLTSEVDLILTFDRFDSKAVARGWNEAEKAAKAAGGLEVLRDIMCVVLVCNDRTYENGSGFPPTPAPIVWAIKHGFSRRHRGAWRFGPCDFNARPRPLHMVPKMDGSVGD